MDSEKIKEIHHHIKKELEQSSLGEMLKDFLTEMPRREFKWAINYLKCHNLDLNDKTNEKQIENCYFFHRMFSQQDFSFISLRKHTETLVEVDFYPLQSNLLLSCKLEKNSIENSDLKQFKIAIAKNRGQHELITQLSAEKGLKRLENIFDRLEHNNTFSGNIVIEKNGRTILKRTLGEACQRYQIKNDFNTKFNLGSMNKIFTAVAILQLYERQKLNLEDPVANFLPYFPNGDKITIHHLLSHQSGLGSFWNKKYEERFARLRSIDDYMDLFIRDELLFSPGERFGYSNAGYMVLGKIIEVITGLEYDQYIQNAIFNPIKMENTFNFEIDYETPNLAMGYTHSNIDDVFLYDKVINNFLLVPVKGGPAGGGYSTIDDLLKFIHALNEGKLISTRSLQLMQKPEIKPHHSTNYGYGCQTGSLGQFEWYGHGGGANGVASMLMIFPKIDLALVILSNLDPMYEVIVEYQVLNALEHAYSPKKDR